MSDYFLKIKLCRSPTVLGSTPTIFMDMQPPENTTGICFFPYTRTINKEHLRQEIIAAQEHLER